MMDLHTVLMEARNPTITREKLIADLTQLRARLKQELGLDEESLRILNDYYHKIIDIKNEFEGSVPWTLIITLNTRLDYHGPKIQKMLKDALMEAIKIEQIDFSQIKNIGSLEGLPKKENPSKRFQQLIIELNSLVSRKEGKNFSKLIKAHVNELEKDYNLHKVSNYNLIYYYDKLNDLIALLTGERGEMIDDFKKSREHINQKLNELNGLTLRIYDFFEQIAKIE